MFSEELRKLLAEVIGSWQVLVVTVVLIIYVFLINYVARTHYRRRSPKMTKPKKVIPESIEPSDDDELGLEDDA